MTAYTDPTVEVYEDGIRILCTGPDGARMVVSVLPGASTVVVPGLRLTNMDEPYATEPL